MLESSLPLDLKEAANQALDALETQYVSTGLVADYAPGAYEAQQTFATQWITARQKVYDRVLEFFAERLRYYLESVSGLRYDTVRAVVAAGAGHPADAHARAQVMESLRGGEDFEALSAAAKRIRNILTKSASAAEWQAGEVDAALLGEVEERELYNAYRRVVGETREWAGEGSAAARGPEGYRRALEAISTLRPTVDRFFDKVLVMAEDPAVRQNRLRLLTKLDELFSGIAHFAEIEGK